MLTKAIKQAICTFTTFTGQNNVFNSIPMFPNESIRNTQNQERWISSIFNNLISTLNDSTTYGAGFSIGSGTTPPTENDYNLENQITSGYRFTFTSSTRGVDANGKLYMEFNLTYTNTGSTPLTISEICLKTANVNVCTSSTATTIVSNNIMIDRTLLDEPVTIAPTGSATIKYRITTDMSFN